MYYTPTNNISIYTGPLTKANSNTSQISNISNISGVSGTSKNSGGNSNAQPGM